MKEDIETATVVKEEEIKPVCCSQRLKDRLIYIYGIIFLDICVYSVTNVFYNSSWCIHEKDYDFIILLSYRCSFLVAIPSTIGVIFDMDQGCVGFCLFLYAFFLCCLLVFGVYPFLIYFLVACYTTVSPWVNAGGVLGVIWNLTPL